MMVFHKMGADLAPLCEDFGAVIVAGTQYELVVDWSSVTCGDCLDVKARWERQA